MRRDDSKLHVEQLTPILGKEVAKETIKLLDDYDKYVTKLKTRLNSLLEASNLEVKIGIAFVDKETKPGE